MTDNFSANICIGREYYSGLYTKSPLECKILSTSFISQRHRQGAKIVSANHQFLELTRHLMLLGRGAHIPQWPQHNSWNFCSKHRLSIIYLNATTSRRLSFLLLELPLQSILNPRIGSPGYTQDTEILACIDRWIHAITRMLVIMGVKITNLTDRFWGKANHCVLLLYLWKTEKIE